MRCSFAAALLCAATARATDLPVFGSLADLPVDAQGHLASSWLLMLSGCGVLDHDDLPGMRPRVVGLVAPGGALAAALGLAHASADAGADDSVCDRAAALELGTAPEHVAVFHKRWSRDGAATDGGAAEGEPPLALANWIDQELQRAEIGFISYAPNPLSVLWVANSGERIPQASLNRVVPFFL